jgi:hypothetical protein
MSGRAAIGTCHLVHLLVVLTLSYTGKVCSDQENFAAHSTEILSYINRHFFEYVPKICEFCKNGFTTFILNRA